MANKFATNYPIPSATNIFSVAWKTTRIIKAAGWTYKASANFAAKDTSGVASNDLWGNNADPTLDNYSNISTTTNSGSVSIAGFAGAGTLTVVATASFPAAGLIFVATTANGWQPVTYTAKGATTFTGCTTINAVGAIVNGDPVASPLFTTTNSGSVSLPQATLTVASTVGFPATGVIYVQSSGGIQTVTYSGLSPTTFTGCSGGTGNIVNGNIVSNGANTIGLDDVAGWIVFSGPQTLKIPLNAAPTGVPFRGEKITQATTSAEGELLGFVWDTVSAGGWMAIMPRTGSFDNSHVITGSSSGATLTPLSSQPLTVYQREMMLFKVNNDVLDGSIFYICADGLEGNNQTVNSTTVAVGSNGAVLPQATINVASTTGFPTTGTFLINTSVGLQLITYTGLGGTTFTGCSGGTGTLSTGGSVTQSGAEGNQLFSTLATSSGAATNLGPGMGGTNNAFPTKAIAIRGTGGTNLTNSTLYCIVAAFLNNAQIMATNCTPATNVSADGSFYSVVSNSNAANTAMGFGLQRVDDTEPGDCDPYVFLTSNNGITKTTWTGATTTGSAGSVNQTFTTTVLRNTAPLFLGYQGRGTGLTDTINGYTGMPLADIFGTTYAIATGGLTNPIRIVNTPAAVKPLVFEAMGVYSGGLDAVANSTRQYKGRLRWLFLCMLGNTYDTFANKTLLGVSIASAGIPCIIIGPYDGVTIPII